VPSHNIYDFYVAKNNVLVKISYVNIYPCNGLIYLYFYIHPCSGDFLKFSAPSVTSGVTKWNFICQIVFLFVL